MPKTRALPRAVARPRKPRSWRRWTAGLATAAAVLAAPVASATPAAAWPWDAHVSLSGIGTCRSVPLALDVAAQRVRVHVMSSGAVVERPIDWYSFGFWELPLTDIPQTGSPAEMWLYCAGPGMTPGWRFAGTLDVGRPAVGSSQATGWRRG